MLKQLSYGRWNRVHAVVENLEVLEFEWLISRPGEVIETFENIKVKEI